MRGLHHRIPGKAKPCSTTHGYPLRTARCSNLALGGIPGSVQWLLIHKGKFVVIVKEEVLGFFDTLADSYKIAVIKYPDIKDVFIKEIQVVEPTNYIAMPLVPIDML